MITTISSKGQVVLPAELRQRDNIKAGEEFEVERVDRGEYLLRRKTTSRNEGLVDDRKNKGAPRSIAFATSGLRSVHPR